VKKCTRCSAQKELKCFNKKGKNRDGSVKLQPYCKECNKKYLKEHYINNKEQYRARNRKRKKKMYPENMIKIWNYLLEHPCVDCSERDPVVLQFDHMRDKRFPICKMATGCYSWEKIKEEIEKCEVRCANCHMRRTAKQMNWYEYIREPQQIPTLNNSEDVGE